MASGHEARSRRRQLEPGSEAAVEERRKASIRAKVEHPFLWVKRRFGYAKVRYRGLAKNTQRLALLLGLANLHNSGASPGSFIGPRCAQLRGVVTTTPRLRVTCGRLERFPVYTVKTP